jgi:hypothetical protein
MTIKHQRDIKIEAYFARHSAALSRQGAVVAGWRWRAGRRMGPYFRLDLRHECRKPSLYLGREGPFVANIRARLAQLQDRHRHEQLFARAHRVIGRGRKEARAKLASELEKFGLRLQGSEVRGFRSSERWRDLCHRLSAGQKQNLKSPDTRIGKTKIW